MYGFRFKHAQYACCVDLTKYMQNKFVPPNTGMSTVWLLKIYDSKDWSIRSRDSVVSTLTEVRYPAEARDFSKTPKYALETTRPPTQCVTELFRLCKETGA